MPRRAVPALLALSVVLAARISRADCDAMPWSRLDRTAIHLLRPVPLGLLAESTVPPLVMISSGADHRLRVFGQRDAGGRPGLEDASLYAPYLVAALALTTDVVAPCEVARPSAAVAQAMGLSAVSVLALKWVVGRNWPNDGRDPAAPDRLDHPERARDFEPLRMQLSAWPSGHTATLFAAAAALRTSAPDLGLLGWLGYPMALAVGAGMWLNDRHWASDIVSGALVGEAIGASVGASFAERETSAVAWWVLPTPGGGLVFGAGASF